MNDPLAIARDYAKRALSGRGVIVGGWMQKAAARFLADLKTARDRNSTWVYSKEHAAAAIGFIELLPHIKGEWARRNETLRMEPWQQFILCNLFGFVRRSDGTRRFRRAYISCARKQGKALALDTPIPTPDGWKALRDIRIGDQVFDDAGQPCRVIGESPIFLYHDCYKVTFSNGESVIADAGHLWKTTARSNHIGHIGRTIKSTAKPKLVMRTLQGRNYWYANLRKQQCYIGPANKISEEEAIQRFHAALARNEIEHPQTDEVKTRIRTTEEIRETLRAGSRGDLNHSMPMPEPLRLPEVDLPIPPYTLGAWLGDGTSESATITAGQEDAEQLAAEIERDSISVAFRYYSSSRSAATLQLCATEYDVFGNVVTVSKNSPSNLKRQLRAVGVLNNKHIPAIYLRASFAQRLALLQGLMDTDGTADKAGRSQSYTTTSAKLAEGVGELLASLGIKYSIRESSLTCNGRPVKGTGYTLQFHCFRDVLPVFRMPRKLERMRDSTNNQCAPRSRSVQIVSVDPVPSVPVKCIAVDAPTHLFRFGRTMLPTHNSSFASAIGLYMLCADGEAGAEVYALATTREQAGIVFNDARAMVRKSQPLTDHFGLDAGVMAIARPKANGAFKLLPGDPGDGTNPHCAIVDEYHEHQSPRAYDAMYSGMGARRQPLLLVTTTAGHNRAGPCYQLEAYSHRVLDGQVDDQSLFAVLYTLDPNDDWTDPLVWPKANPNLGISVSRENLEEACFEAQHNSVRQVNFLTKRMNIWVNAGTQWLDARDWEACMDASLQLDQFAGRRAILGLDLASKIDLCALEILIEDGPRWVRFGLYYLPEDPVMAGASSTHAHYYAWHLDGRLILTPGNVTDYGYIKADIQRLCRLLRVEAIAYDPYQATQLATELLAEKVPMIEVKQTVANLSEPMKNLMALIKAKKIAHDGCPVMTWQLSNVVAYTDAKDNIYPRKESPENKIDSPVALIMAVSRAMVPAKPKPKSVYELQALEAAA